MEKEFVPHELAAKLKELGFDEECLAYYNKGSLWISNKRKHKSFKLNSYLPDKNSSINDTPNIVFAPLWQQAFDWLFNNFSYICIIENNTNYEQKQEKLKEAIRHIQDNKP